MISLKSHTMPALDKSFKTKIDSLLILGEQFLNCKRRASKLATRMYFTTMAEAIQNRALYKLGLCGVIQMHSVPHAQPQERMQHCSPRSVLC